MHAKAALGSFFAEFSKLEEESVGAALRSLAEDDLFVQRSEKLLQFDARLTLLRRLALTHRIPASRMFELELTLARARKLRDLHDEIARNPLEAAGPSIEGHVREVVALQQSLTSFAEEFNRQR